MRVLLLSTYELGHQPLHVASPAGALLRAGHEVRATDLAVDPLDPADVAWADAVAVSVPMHTAMRLGRAVAQSLRALDPRPPLCFYGLYAGLDGALGTPPLADRVLVGEYEPHLVDWVDRLAGTPAAAHPDDAGSRVTVGLGRGRFGLPARHLLPGLERYAHLAVGAQRHVAGYTEAGHGCAHRCRHCPVPVVYDGRTRLVGEDAVVADVAQLVAMGARHVTFGDPDFLNGPRHALRVIDAVHASFPDLTFDVTAKVEHVLRHRHSWAAMAGAGCLFVVSAFESASDDVLRRLDKGHTAAESLDAVAVLRGAGIEPRPSLLPFTPWTTRREVVDLLDLVARGDLIGNVDPVQYSIRLLVPPGSLLVSAGLLDHTATEFDPAHLGFTWRTPDPALDRLQRRLAQVAEEAAAAGWAARHAYDEVRRATLAEFGMGAGDAPEPQPRSGIGSPVPADDRPRLTEAWFCCAEPSGAQFDAIGAHAPLTTGSR